LVETFLKNIPRFEVEIAAQGLDYESNGVDDDQRRLVLDDKHPANYVEQIKQANREVFTLYSLAREFSSSLDLDETLALFAEKVKEFVPYDSIAISLLSDDPEAANIAYAAGLNNSIFEGRKVKLGQGATGYVLKKEKPVINVDPALDLTFTPDESVADYRIMATLPLFADDKLIGAVSLYSCVLENYKDEHIRLLETISHIAADAINASLQHAEAESHALTDALTGLPNSRSLRSHFDKEVMRASRNGKRFQLVVMDLDGFKSVNDNFGHKAGDRMLKSIGGILKDQLREYDFLARYGGDEFVAIIPETDLEHINSLNQRITEAVVGFRLEIGNGAIASVGISLGASSFPEHGESLDGLIEAADKQMYIAKEGNRRRKQKRQKDAELEVLGDLIPAELIPESHYDVEVFEIGDSSRAF
jgi:diguanylate cyclase (GGDEF)-like protein